MKPDERPIEIEPDPRESPFELPPVDGLPFANDAEKARAISRVIEQAERERASRPRAPQPSSELGRQPGQGLGRRPKRSTGNP